MYQSTKMFTITFLLATMSFNLVQGSKRMDPLVKTKVGMIRGLNAEDGDYTMFLGIPYAKVNESNPFGLSTPYPEFEEIFDANDDLVICPQPSFTPDERADCLRLHIYVPNSNNTSNLLPVLIWIHGGGFVSGSGNRHDLGPKFLVKQDIILVTINYRLGAYGFMCLDDDQVPGNQGLRDQLAAIRWVNENIESFGGDMNKITISGESAGSASVDLHLMAEPEYLFQQAILESGTGLSPFAQTKPDINAPLKIAEKLGFLTNSTKEALAYLATVDTKEVTRTCLEIGLVFLPCVEKKFDNVEAFITEDFNNATPRVNDLRILIGSNDDEMIYVYAHTDMSTLGDLFYYRLNTLFELGDKLDEVTKIVRHFYIGDKEISDKVKPGIVNFDSDIMFQYPIEKSIKKYLNNGGKVYRYVFSYLGKRNYLKDFLYNVTIGGASHADELGYLFDMAFMTEEPNDDDQQMIERITTLWANFVKFGNPTPNVSDLLPITWPMVTKDNMPYLSLDKELTVKGRPFQERIAFWDLFYSFYWSQE